MLRFHLRRKTDIKFSVKIHFLNNSHLLFSTSIKRVTFLKCMFISKTFIAGATCKPIHTYLQILLQFTSWKVLCELSLTNEVIQVKFTFTVCNTNNYSNMRDIKRKVLVEVG